MLDSGDEKLTSVSHGALVLFPEMSGGSHAVSHASFQSSSPPPFFELEEKARRLAAEMNWVLAIVEESRWSSACVAMRLMVCMVSRIGEENRRTGSLNPMF